MLLVKLMIKNSCVPYKLKKEGVLCTHSIPKYTAYRFFPEISQNTSFSALIPATLIAYYYRWESTDTARGRKFQEYV